MSVAVQWVSEQVVREEAERRGWIRIDKATLSAAQARTADEIRAREVKRKVPASLEPAADVTIEEEPDTGIDRVDWQGEGHVADLRMGASDDTMQMFRCTNDQCRQLRPKCPGHFGYIVLSNEEEEEDAEDEKKNAPWSQPSLINPAHGEVLGVLLSHVCFSCSTPNKHLEKKLDKTAEDIRRFLSTSSMKDNSYKCKECALTTKATYSLDKNQITLHVGKLDVTKEAAEDSEQAEAGDEEWKEGDEEDDDQILGELPTSKVTFYKLKKDALRHEQKHPKKGKEQNDPKKGNERRDPRKDQEKNIDPAFFGLPSLYTRIRDAAGHDVDVLQFNRELSPFEAPVERPGVRITHIRLGPFDLHAYIETALQNYLRYAGLKSFLKSLFFAVLPILPNHLRAGYKGSIHDITRTYNRVLSCLQNDDRACNRWFRAITNEDYSEQDAHIIKELLSTGSEAKKKRRANLYAREMSRPLLSAAAEQVAALFKQILHLNSYKRGLMDRSLFGLRTGYSGRTVITPAPSDRVAPDEVGMSVYLAKRLPYRDVVAEENVEDLTARVANGPERYPGAVGIHRIATGKYERLQVGQAVNALQIGDVVERHLQNGDLVVLNRQPTLHMLGIMGHKARILSAPDFPEDPAVPEEQGASNKTLRIWLPATTPYAADFDGDEMNLHVPQTQEAREAVRTHMYSANFIISPLTGTVSQNLVKDGEMAVHIMTKPTTWFGAEHARDLLQAVRSLTARADAEFAAQYPLEAAEDLLSTEGRLPSPAKTEPDRRWSGSQLLMYLLPVRVYNSQPVVLEQNKPNTVEVKEGRVHVGTLQGSPAQLLCKILAAGATRDAGRRAVCRTMHRLQALTLALLSDVGYPSLANPEKRLFGYTVNLKDFCDVLTAYTPEEDTRLEEIKQAARAMEETMATEEDARTAIHNLRQAFVRAEEQRKPYQEPQPENTLSKFMGITNKKFGVQTLQIHKNRLFWQPTFQKESLQQETTPEACRASAGATQPDSPYYYRRSYTRTFATDSPVHPLSDADNLIRTARHPLQFSARTHLIQTLRTLSYDHQQKKFGISDSGGEQRRLNGLFYEYFHDREGGIRAGPDGKYLVQPFFGGDGLSPDQSPHEITISLEDSSEDSKTVREEVRQLKSRSRLSQKRLQGLRTRVFSLVPDDRLEMRGDPNRCAQEVEEIRTTLRAMGASPLWLVYLGRMLPRIKDVKSYGQELIQAYATARNGQFLRIGLQSVGRIIEPIMQMALSSKKALETAKRAMVVSSNSLSALYNGSTVEEQQQTPSLLFPKGQEDVAVARHGFEILNALQPVYALDLDATLVSEAEKEVLLLNAEERREILALRVRVPDHDRTFFERRIERFGGVMCWQPDPAGDPGLHYISDPCKRHVQEDTWTAFAIEGLLHSQPLQGNRVVGRLTADPDAAANRDRKVAMRTTGSDWSAILRCEAVDVHESHPTNLYEMCELLGIEAARAYLHELLTEMIRDPSRHASFVADAVTWRGVLQATTYDDMQRSGVIDPFTIALLSRSMQRLVTSISRADQPASTNPSLLWQQTLRDLHRSQ